ncbi:MAG: DUF4126 domain-containing protein [Planctomycetota bacterium]|jgi:hypothetical protein
MDMQLVASIVIGICLSAACGLKVFVPPLVAGLAHKAGVLSLSEHTQWLGTWPAISALAIAVVCEFVGFCIPVFGNLLDIIATPASVVAGAFLMSSQVETSSPLVNWSLAIAGGGVTSGLVATIMAAIRSGASIVSAGISNFFVALFELASAAIITVLTLFAPLICLALVILLVLGLLRAVMHFRKLVKDRLLKPT